MDVSPSQRPGLLLELLSAGATLTFNLDGVTISASNR
jgi:hypothetical protein